MPEPDRRYFEAEQAFLDSEGVDGPDHHVDLARLGGRVRIRDVGEGPPVLFVPGVMTTGAVFAGLVGRLHGYRRLLLDRPGTGLSPLLSSPPTDLAGHERVGDHLVVDVLDGLGIDAAHVVSTSLGGWYAFRGAAAHPERVLTLSGLAFQGGARIENAPLIMRLSMPGWMTPTRLRANRRMVRAMLKMAGMRSAIDTGRVSDEMFDWMVALLRHTDTFGNDSQYSPGPIDLRGPIEAVRHSPELLGKVTPPVRLIWGSDDLFGGESSAREFASLLPDADLQMVPGAGHAPWLDEPELVADAVRDHLRR